MTTNLPCLRPSEEQMLEVLHLWARIADAAQALPPNLTEAQALYPAHRVLVCDMTRLLGMLVGLSHLEDAGEQQDADLAWLAANFMAQKHPLVAAMAAQGAKGCGEPDAPARFGYGWPHAVRRAQRTVLHAVNEPGIAVLRHEFRHDLRMGNAAKASLAELGKWCEELQRKAQRGLISAEEPDDLVPPEKLQFAYQQAKYLCTDTPTVDPAVLIAAAEGAVPTMHPLPAPAVARAVPALAAMAPAVPTATAVAPAVPAAATVAAAAVAHAAPELSAAVPAAALVPAVGAAGAGGKRKGFEEPPAARSGLELEPEGSPTKRQTLAPPGSCAARRSLQLPAQGGPPQLASSLSGAGGPLPAAAASSGGSGTASLTAGPPADTCASQPPNTLTQVRGSKKASYRPEDVLLYKTALKTLTNPEAAVGLEPGQRHELFQAIDTQDRMVQLLKWWANKAPAPTMWDMIIHRKMSFSNVSKTKYIQAVAEAALRDGAHAEGGQQAADGGQRTWGKGRRKGTALQAALVLLIEMDQAAASLPNFK